MCNAVKAKIGYLEESKIYFDLFHTYFGYYMIPYALFHSLFSLLFYNVENNTNEEKPLNE